MEMPQPTPAHEKLAKLAGTWSGDETCHPSPWNPERSRATGGGLHELALGGLHVIADYRQEKDGQVTYEGHGVYSYDETEDSYLCHWFDNMATGAQLFRGKWQGDVLTLLCEYPTGHNRLTYDLAKIDDGRYGFRMESSEDGKKWTLLMEATYERAAVAQT